MNTKAAEIFANEGITECACIPFSDSEVLFPHYMPEDAVKSVIVFLVPYRTADKPEDGYGISCYARVKDYHGYMKGLFERLTKPLSEAVGGRVYGFSDRSPLNEKLCAARAGLGVIGRNSLLINRRYGSYVFIGVFLSTSEPEDEEKTSVQCPVCGECSKACPGGAINDFGIDAQKCLSGLSQKKKLTEEEQKKLTDNRICWGCDVCQNVCPLNADTEYSHIGYFTNTFLSRLSPEVIASMSDEEFSMCAFSWRGKETIIRNMIAADKAKNSEK